ncbi:MAG: hypothetical protein HSCHL_1701 [Hydrogenibacillus schlegelii]|uniref:Uncharacterized protein n=1 Tax=Hydrogenibacillus schlegelii TaxID=1484 RepID=A0A2T5G4C1_HYDSH|nr:MAG: hypothetical protein HSCHL_1701 [Hydrogenibacillus schlegelii]
MLRYALGRFEADEDVGSRVIPAPDPAERSIGRDRKCLGQQHFLRHCAPPSHPKGFTGLLLKDFRTA